MMEYIVNFLSNEINDFVIHERIVRCCNCKHHEYMTVSYSDNPLSVCVSEQWIGAEGDNPLVTPNGFCKWGERK